MISFSSTLEKLSGLALAMLRQGAALRLPQTAGSLAFLSLLALVPIMSLVLSVMAALPVFSRMRDALQKFLATNLFLPTFSDTLLRYVNQFAAKASELSVLGAIGFFATAFAALLTIDRTINLFWGATELRPLSRRITLYWTLLTLGPLLLAAGLAVNGLIIRDLLSELHSRDVQRAWLSMLPALTSFIGLTLLYRLVPNAPVRWIEAVTGAFVTALVLEALRRWLGGYVARLPTYTVVYGTFAALPLFLFWLYLFWLTVLAGALLAANLRFWGHGFNVHLPSKPADWFDVATFTLIELAARLAGGQMQVRAETLRRVFGADAARADEVAALLADCGYMHRAWRASPELLRSQWTVWNEDWALAAPPERLTLKRLFDAIWCSEAMSAGGAARARFTRRARGRAPAFEIDAPLLSTPLSEIAAPARS